MSALDYISGSQEKVNGAFKQKDQPMAEYSPEKQEYFANFLQPVTARILSSAYSYSIYTIIPRVHSG
jgi:hypothetical protein